ncbi:MAG: DNA polymerase III subunit delta [Gemmatimonadetes bacterium]|nr:DNA polymerase III subunit delta [Gemmatimonadota bacterium]
MNNPLPKVLTQGSSGGVFFLYGEDEHRKAEAVQALVEAHLDPGTRDFNLDIVEASDVSVDDLARILATPPMMAERRVVVVKGTEVFAGAARSRDLILGLVENPLPDLALILSARIPERSKAKFYQTLIKRTQSVEFASIAPEDVPGWLMEEAKARFGATMEPDAARALGQAIGTDLGILSREIEKLAAVAGAESRITLEHVRTAGIVLLKQDRWKWFDLVGARRFREAVAGVRVLLNQGESGVGLTVGLSTHLLRIGLVVESGPRALEEVLPPHQRWLSRQIGAQAGGWSADAIRSAILGLLRVDRLLKASSLSDEHHLEEWLLALMSREDVAA